MPDLNFILELDGWCELPKAKRIYELVKESNAQLIIEIGIFGGRSLLPMAIACKEKGSGGVIGIDAWKAQVCLEGTNDPRNNEYWQNMNYEEVYNKFIDAIRHHGLFDYIDVLRTKGDACACMFADDNIDILHQDSNHNVETITAELEKWNKKLKVGGYWIVDDTDWVESKDGYAKLPDYGFELFEDHGTWQIWKRIK